MSARHVAAAGAIALAAFAGPSAYAGTSVAAEDTGSVDVVDTETVKVYLDAEGKVDSKRVYEQLTLRGTGKVTVANPVSTDGLRNLDGFGSPDIEDGAQVATYDVDGVVRTRTVSDHEGELPLKVTTTYLLDGKEIEPGDIVGAEGLLEARYRVENTTARTRELTVADGHGGTTTRSAEVAVPYAGSMTMVLPEQFTDVSAAKGVLAGDGRGGTKVSFTLTLFPPIGASSTEVGWKAEVRDGVLPRAELTALPVDPLANPSFQKAADSYKGGRDAGIELADGAGEIDANLIKLRNGAQDLLGGLLQLHAGAEELSAGLNDKAVPGAKELAAGAGRLDDGIGQIADGTSQLDDGLARLEDGAGRLDDGVGRIAAGSGELADGATQVADGADAAASGSADLRDGLARISGGLGQLADVDGLPAALEGVGDLKAGVDQILAGFGAVGTTGTLLDGLARLETGLGQLSAGLVQLRGDGSAATPGLVGAKGGVDQVQTGLSSALATGGSLDVLVAGLTALKGLDCGPVCDGVIDAQIIPGVEASRTSLTAARNGLLQVSGGLGQAITGLNSQLIPGAQAAATGATSAKAGATALKTGLSQVRAGLADLEAGLTDAVAGVLALDAGAGEAYAGAGDLADGLGLLSDGAGRVSTGAGELAAGAADAHDGSSQVADGAADAHDGSSKLAAGTDAVRDGSSKIAAGNGELATKLVEAADGSTRIADGLGEAAGGTPKLVDGAGRLSKEGARVIEGKGAKTAQDYGELVAVMEAGSALAHDEAMAYGAPEGALGLTAYSYVIEGEDGAGTRNVVRVLTGAGLLGVGGGMFLLRRRWMPV